MKKIIHAVLWLVIPFVIGAMCQFSESWIAIPASVILWFFWLGITGILAREE